MQYNFDEIINRHYAAKYDERKKKFGRDDVIPLWVADMDFRAAQPIIDALEERVQEGIWGYTSRPDSYFNAITEWQKKRHGWEIDASLVSWSLGVVPSLVSLVQLFTSEGDNILIQTPVYSEFYEVVETQGRNVLENKLIEKNGVWSIDFEDFSQKIKKVSMFLLCSPHNPLGIVWSKEDLMRMEELCAENNVLLVSDEIHSDLVFHGKKHIPTATISQRAKKSVISCISGTKTFNMAGLQASTTVFPNKEMKEVFDKYWFNMDIHRNNAFSLVAMEAAFRHGEEWLTQLLSYLSGNFDLIRDFCEKEIPLIHPSYPDATYLVWLDCRRLGLNNQELHDFMIEKAGLGLNDGYTFGHSLTGFMRLNAACPRSVLRQALTQLKDAVNQLKK